MKKNNGIQLGLRSAQHISILFSYDSEEGYRLGEDIGEYFTKEGLLRLSQKYGATKISENQKLDDMLMRNCSNFKFSRIERVQGNLGFWRSYNPMCIICGNIPPIFAFPT